MTKIDFYVVKEEMSEEIAELIASFLVNVYRNLVDIEVIECEKAADSSELYPKMLVDGELKLQGSAITIESFYEVVDNLVNTIEFRIVKEELQGEAAILIEALFDNQGETQKKLHDKLVSQIVEYDKLSHSREVYPQLLVNGHLKLQGTELTIENFNDVANSLGLGIGIQYIPD